MKKQELLRVALAQVNVTVGDLKKNTEKIINFIKQSQDFKADIVSFPELAICGYPPEDLLLKKHFVRDNLKALEAVIKETCNIAAVVGFVAQDAKGNLYNAAAIIKNGRLKGVYHKIALPNYGVFDEKRYFQQGNKASVFELGGLRFGVNICEDIWKVNGPAKIQAEAGAGLIINISSSPYYAGKGNVRKKMLRKRAQETKTYICYTNLVGAQDELVFDGGSMIIGPDGEEKARGKQFEEDLVVADLPLHHKPRFYPGAETGAAKPDLPGTKYKQLNKIAEIYKALVLGTSDYIGKNGFKKVLIGLSGGIDSAVTALIARDAVGSENVTGVSMPSQYSSKETQSDAKILADNLGIELIVVSIKNILDVYLAVLKKEFKGLKADVTEENLQARIRGNILMAFSNKFGWMALTTGNKSETSVGYCTLYGDTAGGFAVLKDVPKTMVYKLAKFRNEKGRKSLIPESILKREPSAELKAGQKDKDTLPPYSVLDAILKDYVEGNKGFEEIISSTKFDSGIVKEVIRLVDKNEYKRRQSPPGVRITPKAFGKDRRFPITAGYKEY